MLLLLTELLIGTFGLQEIPIQQTSIYCFFNRIDDDFSALEHLIINYRLSDISISQIKSQRSKVIRIIA